MVYSVNGVPIRLTEERWHRIAFEHPKMEPHEERVTETLRDPESIQEEDLDELIASRFYEELEERGKNVFTIYRELGFDDEFIITAYMNEQRFRKKAVLWTRP